MKMGPTAKCGNVLVINDLSGAILVSTLLGNGGNGHPINLNLEVDTRSSLAVKATKERTN